MEKKIGIIAGNGNLPNEIAKEATAKGYGVYICGIRGEAEESLASISKGFEWVKLGQLGKLAQFFISNGVTDVLMAGKIRKVNLFKGDVSPDLDMLKVIMKTPDRSDDTLLGAVADYLESKGIKLLSSVFLIKDALPEAGVLSKRKPKREDEEEMAFGWTIAKHIAGLDIGQTVVTKNKAVMAIEAIEGTDEAILRGSELGGGDVNVIKVAKPNQDMRFDVPALGLGTLEVMLRAKVRMLVFEAGKTILLDREEFLKRADRASMIIVARPEAGERRE